MLLSTCGILLTLHLYTVFFLCSCTQPSTLHLILVTLLYLFIKAQTRKKHGHIAHILLRASIPRWRRYCLVEWTGRRLNLVKRVDSSLAWLLENSTKVFWSWDGWECWWTDDSRGGLWLQSPTADVLWTKWGLASMVGEFWGILRIGWLVGSAWCGRSATSAVLDGSSWSHTSGKDRLCGVAEALVISQQEEREQKRGDSYMYVTWCARENSGWRMPVLAKASWHHWSSGRSRLLRTKWPVETQISDAVRVATIMDHAPEPIRATLCQHSLIERCWWRRQ